MAEISQGAGRIDGYTAAHLATGVSKDAPRGERLEAFRRRIESDFGMGAPMIAALVPEFPELKRFLPDVETDEQDPDLR